MKQRAIARRTATLAFGVAIQIACCAFQARGEPPGRLVFRSFGTHEGLANLVVLRLVQDRLGFIWGATEDGLFQFDGSHFERFGNAEGLPSSVISALAIENDREVWVGTLRGVAHWQGTRFDLFGPQNGLPQERVNGIALAFGHLWVALHSGLYRRIDGERFELVPGWPGGEATAVWADEDGGLIAASTSGLRHRSVSGTWTTMASETDLARETIDSVVRDGQGVLWARSPTRIWARRPGAASFADETARVPRGNEKGTLTLDRRGRLLFPTAKGLARDVSGHWSLLGTADGVPVRSLHCALEDDEGSLWLGGIGLHQLLGRGLWRVFGRQEGLEGEVAWTELRDAEGRLWVGTDQGLARDAGERWETVHATRGRTVRTVAMATDGATWVGGVPSELLRLGRDGSVERFDERSGVSGKRILRLLFDRSGTLWVATDGAGLLRMTGNRSRMFARVTLPGGADDERIGYLIEDRQGRLWVAGERGLAVLDHGNWRRFTAADGLRVTRTAYVIERRNREMCVAYLEGLGLSCFQPTATGIGEIRHIDASNGLPGARVYVLGEDQNDRLWVGTGLGVAVFSPEGIEQFTEAQGLPSDDTAAMSFLAEPNGDVWIGTSGGLSRFSGSRYAHTALPPRARMISARLGTREFDPFSEGQVKVQHADNTLLVHFAGLTFLDPFRVEHEVRLRPLERDWHVTQVREARYTALGTGDYTFELRVRTPLGAWSDTAQIHFAVLPAWWQRAWFLSLVTVLGVLALTGLVALGVHRHEVKRDRDSQARHEASFRALIQGLPDLVIVHREGRVVYANTAAATLLGWSRPEGMVGLAVLDLVEPDSRPEVVERIRQLQSTGELAPLKEERLLRRDGTVLTFEMAELSLDFVGQPAVVAVGRDVTERKVMQQRLLLSDRMASLGVLAAGVAHEINNPLAYTISNLDLLAGEVPRLAEAKTEQAKALKEMIDDAQDGAERVRRIVRGLKTFSRADEDEPRALDPALVVDQSIELVSHEIRHRATLVRAYAAVGLVWGDESRLVQVFMNLLVNAAHAVPEGHADENEIHVAFRPRDAGHIIVEVRDTGSGIRPEIIGRVFDPFFTTKPAGEGTGLGLSICQAIVNRMGGEITVESEVGKGSIFRVALPIAPEVGRALPQAAVRSPFLGRRGRVLVIDDDLRVAESVRRLLGREHDVTVLSNGESALAHLRKAMDYDLILCDLIMPRITGMELHERLVGLGSGQVKRFVFLTGGPFTEAATLFLEQVPNERIEKPFDNDALRDLARRFVANSMSRYAATA
jgi:PAS domain S-box-containing protein